MSVRKGPSRKLYFIALIPPSPVYEQAQALKEYVSVRYETKAALRSPPHITLQMPFRWREDREDNLTRKLAKFADAFNRGHPLVVVDGFGAFPPRVIYLNIAGSDALSELHRELAGYCRKELSLFRKDDMERPFKPHLTLAFRDLKKLRFRQAWEEFKERAFRAEFRADAFALLKHNGKEWEVIARLTIPAVP